MSTFWTNLLEINLILSLVYLGYILLLKNLTFFRWARFYLLGGMLTALIYPFLKARKVVQIPAEGVTIALPDLTRLSAAGGTRWEPYLVYLFSGVFILLFLRFALRFVSLGKIHARSTEARFNGHTYRDTQHRISPFSFWKWIYIYRKAHSDTEMDQIIAHEHIHTRERHSFDVIIAEICSIICWYNPLVKLLNLSVKDNLEFLVDAGVLNSGIDRVSYQHSLVGISLNNFPVSYPGNQFAFKTLKRRIHMMNKNQSPKSRLIAYMLLTPLVLAFAGLLTFSCQKETLDTLAKAQESEGLTRSGVTRSGLTQSGLTRSVTATYNEAEKKAMIESVELKTDAGIAFKAAAYEIDDQDQLTLKGPVIFRGLSSSSESPLFILDGKPVTEEQIVKLVPETIESMSVVKNDAVKSVYGEKAKNGVVYIVTKARTRQ